jgi:hypothetical protein
MKRATYLVLVVALFAAPLLVAQEQPEPSATGGQAQAPAAKKPKPPKPLDPADVETLTGRPYAGEAEPAPKPGHPLAGEPAPKKGHPLDQRDVDILTGKADRYNQRGFYGQAAPYVYVDVPVSGSRFGSTRFGGDTRTRATPRVFGRPFRGRTPAVVVVP